MTGRFRSLRQAQGLAKRYWVCPACQHQHTEKHKGCLACGTKGLIFFMSKGEMERYLQLKLMESVRVISALELQPAFPLYATGKDGTRTVVTSYKADFRYKDTNGETVVEDYKRTNNPKALDPAFKLKLKWVEAQEGLKVRIVTAS